MMLFKILVCVLMLSSAYARELSIEETAVLDRFLKVLCEESEAGYVLMGKKPACICGFYHKDPFLVGTETHQQSVALREGARLWKPFLAQDVCITVSEKEDPLIPNWLHVITINRPLFREVVKSNRALFQYVLGPCANEEVLLTEVSAGKYHSLLKGDKVLIGEILGFGTQNALYVSRIENLEEACFEAVPPFLNAHKILRSYPQEFLPYTPSFGFSSIEQELSVLQNQVSLSSKKLTECAPEFVFGCLNELEETKQLVVELEQAQEQIQRHLESSLFLKETLEQLSGEVCGLHEGDFKFQFDKHEVNRAIAKGIWESVQDYDRECLLSFIEGIEQPSAINKKVERAALFSSYLRGFIEARNSFKTANEFFASLEQEKKAHFILPHKLCYKMIKKGLGEICEGPLVRIEYSILSSRGHCLAHHSDVAVNLKNTIPGLALGVKGMSIGETREIFIHPSLGYGLENCDILKAVVTLVGIEDNHPYIPSYSPVDLSFLLDDEVLSERIENYKIALQDKGQRIADHLCKCSEMDLKWIGGQLKRFYVGSDRFDALTEKERVLINQVHWNIYFGNSKKAS